MESADHSACCGHKSATTALHQTVDEMEFERGIWKAVIDADLGRVKELLGRDRTCINKRDNSGYTALVRVPHLSHLSCCFPIWVAVLQASQPNKRSSISLIKWHSSTALPLRTQLNFPVGKFQSVPVISKSMHPELHMQSFTRSFE